MKKIIYILFAALLSASCSGELDIPSEMSLSANQELNSSDVDKLLNGLYASTVNPSGYGYFNILFSDILGDDLKPVKFQWVQVQYAYEHKVPANDILNSYLYPYFYTGVSRANLIIKAPSASDAQKAQARYCRALAYMRLTDLYGAVPIIDETYAGGPIKRSSVAKVWSFVIEDLKYAKQYAPAFSGDNTAPTSQAAQALLASAYRASGNLAQAGIEAEDLIKQGKFSLSQDPKGDRDREVIMNFATPAGADYSNAEWGWILSWEARTWNCFAMSDEVTSLISANDKRRAFYEFDEAANRSGYIFTTKYNREGASAELMVSRLAEMYLISAEAGNANRLTEFQAFRHSSLSLENERRVELAAEFVRWRELKMKGETYVLPFPQKSVDANPALKEDIIQ